MNANKTTSERGRAGRLGFTIIEMLMSLMLVSMLLTTIALAMRASMDTYEANRNLSAVNQASRSLAMRIQREVRQAEAVDFTVGINKLVITPPPNMSGLQQITYQYTGGTKTLTYSLEYSNPANDATETLFDADGDVTLSGFYVTYVTGLNEQGLTCTKRVICTTYYTIDGQTSPLVFTASPRRNQSY